MGLLYVLHASVTLTDLGIGTAGSSNNLESAFRQKKSKLTSSCLMMVLQGQTVCETVPFHRRSLCRVLQLEYRLMLLYVQGMDRRERQVS